MNIIIKLFINKGYIYYAIFSTFIYIFEQKIHQIHKENVKGNSCLMFFFNLCRYILTFSWEKKKMNSLTSRKIVAVGQGHVLSTNLSFLLKTLLFTRVSSVLIFHIQYSIPSTSKIVPRSRQLSLNFISKPNISILFYDLTILSPFRSNILVATHTLCLSRDTIRINALIKNWKRKQQ